MINKLTPEQITRFAECRERWTAIGLSTAPAAREEAEAGIREAYRNAALPEPRKIVWCGSPLSQGLVRAIILQNAKPVENIGDSVGASVLASVLASVRDSVWDS